MERGVRGGGEEGGLEGGEGGERDTDPHERSRPEVGGRAPRGGNICLFRNGRSRGYFGLR